MDRTRWSLMTFTLDVDIAMKRMTAEDCLLLAKSQGMGFVDVMNAAGPRLEEYASAARKTGVGVRCYIGTVSFFSNREEKIRQILTAQLDAAARLGASLYMIVPMNPRKDEKLCTRLGKEQVRSRLKTYFALAVSLAAGRGIRVCFETTPQDYTCLSGTADCRWILEQVPELGLVYDTANMLPHGDDPLAYYEALKGRIVHVHVKDVALTRPSWRERLFGGERTSSGEIMKCCVSGQGVIPLQEILSRMDRDGYPGTFALEYSHPERYPSDAAANADRLASHWDFLS